MSCPSVDLKAYVVGELDRAQRSALEAHAGACGGCREELDRLRVTHSALLSLPEEEIPRRISFVSDKVFEPRWWQSMWRSGPAMGFASAAVLAAAILVHAFAQQPRLAPQPQAASVAVLSAAQIEQRIDAQVNGRLHTAVAQAVAESESRQAVKTAALLQAAEKRRDFERKADLLAVQDTIRYYEKMAGRMMVASNNVGNGQ